MQTPTTPDSKNRFTTTFLYVPENEAFSVVTPQTGNTGLRHPSWRKVPASDAGSVLRENLYGKLAGQKKTAASVKTQGHLTERLKDSIDGDKK